MNLKELKELLALMEDHHLAEVEIEREGLRIRLRKTAPGGETIVERVAAHAPAPAAIPAPAAAPAAPPPPKGTPITSPMVGTFYRAPSPSWPRSLSWARRSKSAK